jgi:uncharacterized protein YciI
MPPLMTKWRLPPIEGLLYLPRRSLFGGFSPVQNVGMAEWIYFLHAPRENFAATMTEAESEAWDHHFERLRRMRDDGTLVLAGPTLGRINTGITVFEAPDEAAAQTIMDEDPTILGGFARGELRPFLVSLLRGRTDH